MRAPALLAVLGQPIAHSRSPVMHAAALQHCGIEGRYVACEVAPARLEEALRGLHALGAQGVNLTVPHKEAVLPLLCEVDEVAGRIGAVNTLLRRPEGWAGTNTDAAGYVASLREAGCDPRGLRVAVVGAGGASRAVVAGLQEAGAAHIEVLARRATQATALAADFGVASRPLEALTELSEVDLLVQATSATLDDAGAGAGAALAQQLPMASLPEAAWVSDLVYLPRRTAVLRAAGARRCIDGTGMLIHQGALAFGRWFGVTPPVEAMRMALLASLPVA